MLIHILAQSNFNSPNMNEVKHLIRGIPDDSITSQIKFNENFNLFLYLKVEIFFAILVFALDEFVQKMIVKKIIGPKPFTQDPSKMK